MPIEPKISVVIPAYNAGKFIARTINSVLAQSYRDYELIVVDDGSSDNTGEVVRSFGEKIRYIYQQNAGDGPARNTGIAAARGQWIAFLDHDDEWLPEKLQTQMDLLAKNPDLKWCATGYVRTYGQKITAVASNEATHQAMRGKEYFERYFDAVQTVGFAAFLTSTMMIKKEVFTELGGFDSCWLRCADQDMWWRIAHRFAAIGFIPEALTSMHLEYQSGVNAYLSMRDKKGQNARNLIEKHLKLAQELGDIDEFRPVAKQFICMSIKSNLVHGFTADARDALARFGHLLDPKFRVAVRVLTGFPKLTSLLLRTMLGLQYRLGLGGARRWYSHSEIIKANKDENKKAGH